MADEPEVTPQEPVRSPGSLLAQEMYPNDRPATQPEAVDDPPKVDEPEDPPEAADDADNPEVVDDPSDPEEIELSSLDELAEHFQLDRNSLLELSVTQKINGKEVSAPLSEILSSYRQGEAAETHLSEAKEKANQVTAELNEINQQKEQLTSTIATFSELLKTVESEIDRDVKDINWTKLREDDPAEYAAKKQEIAERRERLDGMKAKAGESYKQNVAMSQQQHQEKLREHVEKERQKLVEAIPELADEEKAGAVRTKIAEDLKSRGFADHEIAQAYDSRLVIMANEARLYRESKAKAGAARKKVVKVPKVLKPGSKADQPKPNGKDWGDTKGILYG